MILLTLKDYIKQKNRVTLKELSLHFQRDPDTLREMLQHWLRKGAVVKIAEPQATNCGLTCHQCHLATSTEVYRYRDAV